MKSFVSLFYLLFFFYSFGFAQVDFEWARQISGSSAEEAETSTTDANGNTIVAGLYTSSVLTVGSTDLVNTNDNETFFDIFLIKYDKDGNVLWAKTAGSAGHEIVNDVATDAAGNVYLVGGYDSEATFDDQVLDNESEMFLAKYSSNGELLWVIDSESNNGMAFAAPNSMVIDNNGDVLLGGPALGSLDATIFGYPYEGNTTNDGYLMKVSSEGSVEWLNIFDAVDPNNISVNEHFTITELGINPAGNQISVSGTFAGVLDFGGITLTNMNYGATAVVNKDIFVATYETDGDLVWVQNIGGLSEASSSLGDPRGIDTDANNNVYLTGVLTGLMIFSNGDTLQTEGFDLPNFQIGYPELFVVKYNSTGDIQWIKKAYSSNDDNKEVEPEAITVDENGNSFITGYYEWDATFGSIQMPLINEGTFIAKVNTDGDFEWVASGSAFGFDTGIDVGIDQEGNAYAVGHHQFTPTFGDFTLGDGGLQGTFVVKVGAGGTSSTSSVQNNTTIDLFPNPVSTFLNVELETNQTETAQIKIINALGEKIYERSVSDPAFTLDVSNLSAGTYFINWQQGDRLSFEKFIKQ